MFTSGGGLGLGSGSGGGGGGNVDDDDIDGVPISLDQVISSSPLLFSDLANLI